MRTHNEIVCEHGQVKRNCCNCENERLNDEISDLTRQLEGFKAQYNTSGEIIATLRAENERLREAVINLLNSVRQAHPEDFIEDWNNFHCPHMRRLAALIAG